MQFGGTSEDLKNLQASQDNKLAIGSLNHIMIL